jgi:hypothetical protein
VGGGQTAAHTSQTNETGYAVIPAIVGASEMPGYLTNITVNGHATSAPNTVPATTSLG